VIDSMFQEGTDAALDDQVARPRPQTPPEASFSFGGLLAAPFRGVGGGTAKSIAFGSEVAGAFGQVWGGWGGDSAGGMFSTQSTQEREQSDAARERVKRDGIDFSNEAGDTFRQRAADILPDPRTAHASEQVVAGLADFATRAVGYSLTLGPLAAPVFGTDVGMEEADRLKQQGVDLATRTKAGAAAGAINAAALLAPMTGATAWTRFGKGVAAGEGAMVGQALAEREIVRAAGYDKIADTFDPLDPVALALGIVPGAIRISQAGRDVADRSGRAQGRPTHTGGAGAQRRLRAQSDEHRRAGARDPGGKAPRDSRRASDRAGEAAARRRAAWR
jgi:hypothetical protein